MISIDQALSNMLTAIYGKQVRESIHDAIYQINENANEAVVLAEISFGTAVTSPTSPTTGFIENKLYLNTQTGILWRLEGGSWTEKVHLKAISSYQKTGSQVISGRTVDTYTITYNDGTTDNIEITNGKDGNSVSDIVVKGTTVAGDVEYQFKLSDGTLTPGTFVVKNAVSVDDIELASTVGNTKNYKVKKTDGTYTPNGFSVSDGQSAYLYIRYSASFDGQGMVTTPTDQTPYIGMCQTTNSTAPTDPAVYTWVRFIGKSGTGSGDMLESEYGSGTPGVVAKAAALFDGKNEIIASELLSKTEYASASLPGVVNKATTLIDEKNSKEADTETLAKFSTDSSGNLNWDNKPIAADIEVDDELSESSENPVQNKIITGEINKLNTALSKKVNDTTVGSLSDLDTDDTSSIVNAINEINGKSASVEVDDETIKKDGEKIYVPIDNDTIYIEDGVLKAKGGGGVTPKTYAVHINMNDTDPTTSVTYPSGYDNSDFTDYSYMDYSANSFHYGAWKDAFFMPKSCMLKYDTTVDYYLDENDESKKADGTASDYNNMSYGGNAMMEFPKIYFGFKADSDGNGYTFICSNAEGEGLDCYCNYNMDGNIVDHFYEPKYFGSKDSSNRLRSISGQSNSVNQTGTNELTYAKNNGSGWSTENYGSRTLINHLLVLMSKSLDTQTKFGSGRSNQSNLSAINTGTMDKKGMFYGDNGGVNGVKVFGIENYWGNIWRRIEGFVTNGSTRLVKMCYGRADGSTADGYSTAGTGYVNMGSNPSGTSGTEISKMHINAKCGVTPSVVNGNTTPNKSFCDGYWYNNSVQGYALVGGGWNNNLPVGAFASGLSSAVSLTSSYRGVAVSCKPLS